MPIPKRRLFQQDQRTIDRYIRRWAHKNARGFSRFIMRRILPLKERERNLALASALREVAKQARKSRRRTFQSSTILLNMALFFLIAERDISAVKIDALTHPDPWKRSLCARMILITIHELDLDKVAGSKFRTALVDAGLSEESKQKATQALRLIRAAQQKAQKNFLFLRNATIGHRDPDAVLQYRSITELNEMEVLEIAAEFYAGARMFIRVLPELMLEASTFTSLLNQLKSQGH